MNIIAGHWKYKAKLGGYNEIPPDGCIDIIYSIAPNGKISWHITTLPETTEYKNIIANTFLEGIRFNSAAIIRPNEILDYLNNCNLPPDIAIKGAVNLVGYDNNLADALMAFGDANLDIKQCARSLGVSVRSLQRLTYSKTGKTPNYWRQLARARIAARHLYDYRNIAQTAYEIGFADQPHLNRAMVKWFNKTPKQIIDNANFNALISADAYF